MGHSYPGEAVAMRVRGAGHAVRSFLADGQIVEQAPPAQLFSQPSDERTRRFLRRITDAGRL
jgi:ABC-type histidine transport system ATPase subunit